MKKIIENVPGLYIEKSENYMFDGCMHSVMSYLKENADYDYTFFSAVTGDTFCQLACPYPGFGFVDSLSNHNKFSSEAICRAFDACGYGFTHVTKDEIQAHKKLWLNEIVSSIDRGLPVLSFGIIGPATCSLICGYDVGGFDGKTGEVLYGWAQFQDWEPENRCDEDECADGYFRKKNGLDGSVSLIFFGAKKEAPSLSDIYRDLFGYIPVWSHLPYDDNGHGDKRVIGVKAFSDWADALLIDELFSEKDKLAERQDAHCGMLCIFATNMYYMPETLRRIKLYCPDLSGKVDKMTAVYQKQNTLCEKIFALQGGFDISEEKLADKEIRLKLSEYIHEIGRLQKEFSAVAKE